MHPSQVDSGDLSPSAPRGVSGDGHAPNQFCDISGSRVELMEPCNSTHKPRVFEAKAASFAPSKTVSSVGHDPTYEKDMILHNKNRFVIVILLGVVHKSVRLHHPTFQRIFDQGDDDSFRD
jgi:hypothetical protein